MDVAFTQDPTTQHKHQCGSTSLGIPALDLGCGFEWEHSGNKPRNSAEYCKRHRCPRCGKGPWYFVIDIHH